MADTCGYGVYRRVGAAGLIALMSVGIAGTQEQPDLLLDGAAPDWLVELMGVDLVEVGGIGNGSGASGGFGDGDTGEGPGDEFAASGGLTVADLRALADDAASFSAPLAESEPAPFLEANELPGPGTWTVSIGAPGVAAETVDGEAGPVDLTLADGSIDPVGLELDIAILDQDIADSVGASAFVFSVTEPGESDAEAEPAARGGHDGDVIFSAVAQGEEVPGDGNEGSDDPGSEGEEAEPDDNDDAGVGDEGGEPDEGDGADEGTGPAAGDEGDGADDTDDGGGVLDGDENGYDAGSTDTEPVGRLAEARDAAVEGEAALPARLTVDFSSFAELYGGGYADRLQVRALADCVLEDPLPADCSVGGRPLASTVNHESHELEVEVEDLALLAVEGVDGFGPLSEEDGEDSDAEVFDAEEAGGQAAGPSQLLLAVTSSADGGGGTYSATDISQTGQWSVTPGSGEFTYSYGVGLPAAAGDPPSVGLSYSSGAVDGITNASNPQSPAAGVGWGGIGNAYIERAYDSCLNDESELNTPDLCWQHHNNVTLSLDGVSGPLIPIDDDYEEWRVQSDSGWRVERLDGANNEAHEGEYWKVTATDGTEYYFGLGENPEEGRSTRSALRVPVYGDNPGEPCRGPDDVLDSCTDMPWRWQLDRIVDPDDNVTTYYYGRGTNMYLTLGGWGNNSEVYDRSGVLEAIEYGSRVGSSDPAAARVEFGRQYRCNLLNDSCAPPQNGTPQHNARYPDVPNELICESKDIPCTSMSPSFFSRTRYSHIRVSVRDDVGWSPVSQTNLGHSLGGVSTGDATLVLRFIQDVGLSQDNDWIVNEATELNHDWMENRVDINESEGRESILRPRVTQITNPINGRIHVQYDQNRPCENGYRPTFWQDNTRDCFPQTTVDSGNRNTGVFNKYLVTRVVEDPREYGPLMRTEYEYEGDPAWAFDWSAVGNGDVRWGWSGWRGYGTATITHGDSVERVRLFRGMDGDPLWANCGGTFSLCGQRDAEVESFDGSLTLSDDSALAGRTLQEAGIGELDGVRDEIVQSTLYEYEVNTTHEASNDRLSATDAQWAGISAVTESVATAPGEFRQRRSETTYESYNGTSIWLPVSTLETGWLDEDERRCSLTSYASNEASWMYQYPATNMTVAGECNSGEVLSVSETYYDSLTTLGEVGDRGNPTRERQQLDEETWAETLTEYDDAGRSTAVTDANGFTTTTSYSTSTPNGIPTEVSVTNALGHETVTEYMPEHRVPVREEGPDGEVTSWEYDALGRMTEVRLPSEQGSDYPSSWFIYLPEPANRAVISASLTSDTGTEPIYDYTASFYDGFGRDRQTQTPSPDGDLMIVTDTQYDDEGQVRLATGAQALPPGDPYDRIEVPDDTWDNAALYNYDDMGRIAAEEELRNGEPARETTYEYGYDTVTVTGPTGHQAREQQDGFGRTISVAERDGDDWVASSYEYDLAGNIVSVADPEGNEITYTYNMVGQRLTQDDPNRGAASFGYNSAGEEVWVADALGNEVHTTYDPLGRAVERRAASPTGDLLSSWEYDTAPGGIGMLHREIRHTDDGNWVSETLGYDERGNSEGTTYTVPEGISGLSGAYTFTQEHDLAGRVISSTLPAVGGLPEETLTTTYDGLGLPRQLMGHEQYVWMVDYDDRARPVSAGYGPFVDGEPWLARHWEYNEDQVIGAMETFVASTAVGGTVSRHELDFDDAGNLASRLSSQNGAEWLECHTYDNRQRLVGSFTVDAGDDCESGDPGSGDLPFERSYSYSIGGNLLERVEDGEIFTYSYPEAGEARPHAPTDVDGDSYTWDANGNLSERTIDGEAETFEWDVEQHLASVEGEDGTTEFVYGPGGERVLRRNPDGGATLFLGGHEIAANADGSMVTGVRSYSFGGELVATRTSDQGTSYMVSDQAGSVEMAIEAGGDVEATRAYDPYGNVREEEGEMTTEQGFVGQIEDPTTNLSYLNARYYDTNIGVFISTDPIYDTNSIATLNPYTYGASNPTTFTDPSGLSPSYIWGIERENKSLHRQNDQLRGHIGKLNSHIDGLYSDIESLQGIIKRQNRDINRLVSTVRAMDRIISQQQAYIYRLEHAVRRLQSIVAQQQAEIRRLRATVRRQQQIINAQAATIRRQRAIINRQAATISYYRGVVDDLGGRLWGNRYVSAGIRSTIHGGGWNADYASNVFAFDRISGLEGELSVANMKVEMFERFGDGAITVSGINEIIDQGISSGDSLDSIRNDVGYVAGLGAISDMTYGSEYMAGYDHGSNVGRREAEWEAAGERLSEGWKVPVCFAAGEIPVIGTGASLGCAFDSIN